MKPRHLKVLGLVQGDPRRAMSAVPGHLFDALSKRCELVGVVDYDPVGAARLALAAATFRPRRAAWRAKFHSSRLAHDVQSARMAERARGAAAFDVAVQVHGWVSHQPCPYVVYIDQTRLMAERGWPSWLPMRRREREDLLERERRMYALAGHVFAMGSAVAASVIQDYSIPPERVSVVGGGLNLQTLPQTWDLKTQPEIVFVGRDFERKGGDVLLEAFRTVRASLPSARLHVVGPRRRLRAPGVVNHGLLPRSAVTALYRRSRVFCMPSNYEPYGLAFAEAMAHGLPCVGTAVQSIPEILGNGEAGVLVPPGDTAALSAILLRLLTDDAMARRVGEAGRARVETALTWDHVADRMEPHLLDVARRCRPADGRG